ncbi:MAG: hypothetical protein WBV94_04005 [Blastocatellia bacterium]
MFQLPLLEVSPLVGDSTVLTETLILCSQCGVMLGDLNDLRKPCEVTGIIHEVSTTDHNALYRKTHKIVLA